MNCAELVTEIERTYTCIVGVPRAYFEIPVPNFGRVRIQYITVNTAMKGSADVNEDVLCGWLFSKLRALLTKEELEDHSTLLVWRAKPTLLEFINNSGTICTAIRARFDIPGKDLYEIKCDEGAQSRYL